MPNRALPPPELIEVAPGVYGYIQPDGSWMVNNTGIITDADGSYLLVDTTSTEQRNRALLATVAEISTRSPRALVNTHHHGDHTYGNWLMPAHTPIIGHVTCREDVLAAGLAAAELLTGPDYGHVELRPPDLTFTDTMTMHLAERQVDLIHVGPAHTRSDVLVWLAEQRTLFAGDLAFAGGQPFLVEGSVAGYPRALARIRELEPDVLIPGHGPVCRGDEVATLLDNLDDYASFVDTVARTGHAAGISPLEAARAASDSRFARWQESERLVGNLHRAYSELDGNPVDKRIPLGAVWTDMVEFNGGPIGCFA
ncbi:cyclase [Tamaricihabitans halophyticus]|uniref:Cyclase n=1 Tax=Tamaricihabitans halophyticus TaxID=1262583 RepID=A0A4R2QXV2_9PSEU|nr:MBL fold metallo-hydrolase [Tamaricihabitans halophyticus]TCP55032.1 cyclase [Tamaricihabitans halophyticus]